MFTHNPLNVLANAVLLIGLLAPGAAPAQIAGDRTIKIVIPYPAGGPTDVNTRMLTQRISAGGGPTFVIENRAGGGGVIAAMAVKHAAPDGLTLFMTDLPTFGINATLMPDLPFNPVRDFKPITLLFSFTSLLVVPTSLGVASVDELVAKAKATPGGLSYGSQGPGSGGQLLAEMFAKATGAPLVHVPYRGSSPAYVDLVAGRLAMMFGSYTGAKGHLANNALRALAVPSKQRLAVLPNVPTLAELGYPQIDLDLWFGLVAPAGTPDDVIENLRALFVKEITMPDVVAKLAEQAVLVVTSTPAQFSEVIKADIERLAPIVKASGALGN